MCLLIIYKRHSIRRVIGLGSVGLPSYFKWREKWLMPVRNQRGCASCWSISVCDMLADSLNLKTGGAYGLNPLSSQYLLSCYRGHLGCDIGDSPENVYDLPQLTEQGIPLESAFPYQASDTLACPKFADGIQRVKTVKSTAEDICLEPNTVVFTSKQDVINRNIVNMKRALQRSPIVGTLRVHHDVYNYDGKSIYTVTPGSPLIGYHAVLIVGYADANANTHEPGFSEGYWVAKSSWGNSWGAQDGDKRGFIYVKMGVNEADIESRASRCDVVVPDELKDAVAATDMTQMAYSSYSEYVNDPDRFNFLGSVKSAHT
ncbi:FirrV-1-A48 precursor [Tribonema minus]|uniref:FirrV-1-A48 n=1 Tax=Tribonema minus TaxID=303371 RepID=A0A836CH74_9STRA|nr:FirrV-1-A48 precursor [Tribonema minus]